MINLLCYNAGVIYGKLPPNMLPFIVLEGPDGSGTTLHTRLLKERLESEGVNVISTSEPTDGPIGKAIRKKLLSGEEIAPADLQKMFAEDRAWHLENVIKPALLCETVVISDRYFHSTLAYGQALGLEIDYLKSLNKDFIQPDCIFFLLPSFEACTERMGRREKHDALEDEVLQKKVYDIYKKMAEIDPSIYVIDSGGGKEEVAEKIFNIVHPRVGLVRSGR